MKLSHRGLAPALLALALAAAASPAGAGPIAEAGARAEAASAAGRTVEALDALEAAIDEVWRASPLAFRTVQLVEEAQAYGRFTPVPPGREYQPGDIVKVYVEPVGFGYGEANGERLVRLNADLAIRNARGQVLAEGRDVFRIETRLPAAQRQFFMTLSFAAPELRGGDYTAAFTVRDANSDKTGSFEVPFRIAPEGAAPAAGATGTAPAAAATAPAAGPGGGAAPAPAGQ